ncbi:Ctf8p and Ctf18p associating protein [Malassezia sp. CBS 17886]|nr:Ctf8p and Ctf18p associating protein [Malassezia sp. CBS 17886]
MHEVPLITGAVRDAPAYVLLELSPDVEACLSKHGAPLLLNGRLADEATLSTADATYAVRQVTQSNSLLLCGWAGANGGSVAGDHASGAARDAPPSAVPHLHLRQNASDILELIRTTPRLDRLVALLHASEYAGESAHGACAPSPRPAPRLYTAPEVRSIVQASDGELRRGLRMHHTIELDGYLRRVSPAFLWIQLRVLLNQLDVLACEPDEVPYGPATAALVASGSHPAVAHAIVADWFGAATDRANPPPAGARTGRGSHASSSFSPSLSPSSPPPLCIPPPFSVALAPESIAQFAGLELLKEAKRVPLTRFIEAWRTQLGPLAAAASFHLLRGHVLLYPPPASFASVSAHSAPTRTTRAALMAALSLQYFPHTQLPMSPVQRFQELFQLRPQWVREELVPFVDALALPGTKKGGIDALLLKYGRSCSATWTDAHAAVLLRGDWDADGASSGDGVRRDASCTLVQTRVKY